MLESNFKTVECRNIILLLLVYTVVYAISVVTRVNSSDFMGVDPQSIVTAINELTTPPYYNMNESYHSKYYGWTYFSINFVIVFIAKFIGFSSEYEINLLIRSVVYIIGACLIIALYILSREFLSKIISFIFVLYFMFDPVVSHYITLIHPESLGMTLQIVGCYFFVKFYKGKGTDSRQFYSAIFFLSLSSLAKQPFFIVNFFIGCIYLKLISDKLDLNYKSISGLFIRSIFIFLICFFVIHPYAFIDLDKFITAQSELSSGHSSANMDEVIAIWFDEYTKSLLFVFHTIVLVLVALSKEKNKYHLISLVTVSMIVALFMYKSRIFINLGYLFPLYLLVFANIIFYIVGCLKRKSMFSNFLTFLILVLFSINFVSNFTFSVFLTHHKYYVDGLATKNSIWKYIDTFPESTRIAYSPNIAVPQPYKSIGCHAWQGCAKSNDLHRYDPDVIIYSPTYTFFESEEYTNYINDNEFSLVYTVSPSSEVNYICSSTASVGEGKGGLNTFYFFDITRVINNISNCINSYKSSIIQNEKEMLTGLEIYVYKK